jgi:5'-nucleotidase
MGYENNFNYYFSFIKVYKTPQLDLLTFKLAIERLIQLGYPKEITDFEYDPTFAVTKNHLVLLFLIFTHFHFIHKKIRGLWYDKLYGNLLKVDPYGNIMICTHGFKILRGNEIYRFYPNKFINFDPSRISVQHTLYEFPESYLIACVVNHFSTSPEYKWFTFYLRKVFFFKF